MLNLHSAILPDYRGIMGTLHNLKENKNKYGCTLHYISNRGIDTGEIIAIAKRDIIKEKSLLWHIVQLYPIGCQLISDSLEELKMSNRLPTIKQNMEEGNYFSVPTKSDFASLKANGIKSFNAEDYIEILTCLLYTSPSPRDS